METSLEKKLARKKSKAEVAVMEEDLQSEVGLPSVTVLPVTSPTAGNQVCKQDHTHTHTHTYTHRRPGNRDRQRTKPPRNPRKSKKPRSLKWPKRSRNPRS